MSRRAKLDFIDFLHDNGYHDALAQFCIRYNITAEKLIRMRSYRHIR